MNTVATHRRRGWSSGPLIAYVLIVAVGVVGFFQFGQVQNDLCTEAAQNRTAIRNLTIGVTSLGTELVKDDPPLNGEERAAIARLREFQETQLALLDVPICR